MEKPKRKHGVNFRRIDHALTTIYVFKSRDVNVDYDKLMNSMKYDGAKPNPVDLRRSLTDAQIHGLIVILNNEVFLTMRGLEWLNRKTNVLQETLFHWILICRSTSRKEIHRYFAGLISKVVKPWSVNTDETDKMCDLLLTRLKNIGAISYPRKRDGDMVWAILSDPKIFKT